MPLKFARVCTCGAVVSNGNKCRCQIARDRDSDRRRPTAHERGYDSKWQRYRINYLAANPNCVMCLKSATVVDWQDPASWQSQALLVIQNHQSLCARCHNSHKQRIEKRQP